MSGDRIEQAVQRIEIALARIAEVADRDPRSHATASALVVKHEALRETVATQLGELEQLIRELEE
ncbi:hypothetical protein [Parerythrobacter lacustris]|uniref:Uncharacterized protein n=1 Tax=Parerythrobacter lacustris TaxID=2969984 RepID=A0ABT1XQT6_9SPHN|nr:hypothetical protein [Parerythrobacter lacustris]MCR2834028.1 hypothetical protein [Parerythrobacter lacustris]